MSSNHRYLAPDEPTLDWVRGAVGPGSQIVAMRPLAGGQSHGRHDRLGGVVDWTSASWGPPWVDFGHMRWNLAALFGRPVADRFLGACRRLNVAVGYTPEYDIRATLDVLPELRPGSLRDRSSGGSRSTSRGRSSSSGEALGRSAELR